MYFYILLIILFYILFTFSESKALGYTRRRLLLILPCFILTFFSIFRYDIGYDYPAYFEMARSSANIDDLLDIEPLSRVFILIANYTGLPWMIFVLFGIPTYCLAFRTCFKIGNFHLAFWVYVFLFYLDSLGVIRQALALSLVMYAFTFMQEKRFLPYLLLCSIAMLFHYSAVIVIPLYFIYHYCSIRGILIVSIVGLLSFKILINLISPYLGGYQLFLLYSESFSGGTFLRYFYVILFLYFLYLNHKVKCSFSHKYLGIVIPGLFFPFLFGGHIGLRISSYFFVGYLYLIPMILSKSSKMVRALTMLGLMFFFLLVLYVSANQENKSPFIPYNTIFNVDLERNIFKDISVH